MTIKTNDYPTIILFFLLYLASVLFHVCVCVLCGLVMKIAFNTLENNVISGRHILDSCHRIP